MRSILLAVCVLVCAAGGLACWLLLRKEGGTVNVVAEKREESTAPGAPPIVVGPKATVQVNKPTAVKAPALLFIPDGERPPENLREQLTSWKTFLAEKLAEPDLWTNAERRQELIEYLRQPQEIPDESFAAVLVENICFGIVADGVRPTPRELLYPAYGALRTVGPTAVPHILKRLKKIDPDFLKPKGDLTDAQLEGWYLKNGAKIAENEHTRELLIRCLIDVYNVGGDGVELARTRISAEVKVSTAHERWFLQAALKHPVLKAGN